MYIMFYEQYRREKKSRFMLLKYFFYFIYIEINIIEFYSPIDLII